MKKWHNLFLGFLALTLILVWIPSAAAVEIGVAWAGKSSMAKRVVKGFEQGMAEKAPDIKIEYQGELDSVDSLAQLAEKWGKEKDGMVLLRSNAAEWLAEHPTSIPTFIGGCNNPVQLGAVKNMNAPEGTITGVTYFLPLDQQFEIFKEILPDMQSVLLLLEEGHPASQIDEQGTKEVTGKLGIECAVVHCKSLADLTSAVEGNKDRVSAIIIGNNALVIDNAKDIVAAAGNTPVLSYSSGPVKSGALGGFVADDEKLGYMLADSVVEVMKNGKAVKDVPVKVDPKPKFYINAKTAQRIDINIPYHIVKAATIIE